MYRFAALIILALTLSGCARNLSSDEARALLQRVQEARRTATLEATFTTSVRVRDQILTSDGHLHRSPGVVQVRYLTGRFGGWQVVEQDGMVWRIDPQGQPTASNAGADPGADMRLAPDLRVRYDGPAWLAGRRAIHYTVRPPVSEQARLELTVDAATYYPLRLERFGTDGQLVSSTVSRKVNFAAAPPQRLAVPNVAAPANQGAGPKRATAATEQQLTKLLGGPLLKPTYLPQGFRPRGMFIHTFRQRQAAEIRYFDGLRMLAVMQLPRPKQGAMRAGNPARPGVAAGRWGFWRGLQQRRNDGSRQGLEASRDQGGVRPSMWRGNVIRERRGDRIVIVAGELAPDELQKIMSSIPYPPGQGPAVKF